jgi:hypothetical protein
MSGHRKFWRCATSCLADKRRDKSAEKRDHHPKTPPTKWSFEKYCRNDLTQLVPSYEALSQIQVREFATRTTRLERFKVDIVGNSFNTTIESHNMKAGNRTTEINYGPRPSIHFFLEAPVTKISTAKAVSVARKTPEAANSRTPYGQEQPREKRMS